MRKLLDALRRRVPERGVWTPLIPFPLRAIILFAWAIEPTARGIDYITGDQPVTSRSLTVVESALPLWMWGTFCLTAGVLIIVGFSCRWRRIAIAGLHIAGATYFALGVGLAVTSWGRGGDGFRTPVMFFTFAVTYWAAAIGYAMWKRPQPVEVVSDDDLLDAKVVPDGDPASRH